MTTGITLFDARVPQWSSLDEKRDHGAAVALTVTSLTGGLSAETGAATAAPAPIADQAVTASTESIRARVR